ncbi:MAG: hypothetical protein PHO20_05905 [Candidatus Peribacteraceae bacterium]|nr:hypothetical protein [Candidatus Peribacteraceae bacterium]MDD5740270.1 hypothetical protein [Candidatus Peribacteraceae bacterium]
MLRSTVNASSYLMRSIEELGRESLYKSSALLCIQIIITNAKAQIDAAIESGDMGAVKLRVDDLIAKIELQLNQSGVFPTTSQEEAGQAPADAAKQEQAN